ncbi:MAG: hypothetical protein JXR91_06120 [Deltaproteobacteria bacterium]|nr:hypothetical protein [Deltaproteobacteria bacterium]
MKKIILIITVIFLLPIFASAQDTDNGTDSGQSPLDDIQIKMESIEKRLDEQNDNIAALKKENEEAKKREAAKEKETLELKENLEQTQEDLDSLVMTVNEEHSSSKFSVYGFFDTTFYKAWYDQKNSVLITQNPPKSTFLMNNINLYFKSEMTPSLEVLVETGLSFAPLGHETNFPADAYVDGKLVSGLIDSSEYKRVDTSIPGGIASSSLRYGSVSIIRAYLDWKPRDFFNIRVGQYLTPYGIWNEDHASTVLVGVYYPNMMNHGLVPDSQMGLQAFGSFFPSDKLQLKYAVTFSNGRGPISTVMDLDENKGVGLRLKAVFGGSKLKVKAGGYGYYGKYTDLERHVESYLNADFSQDFSSGSPIGGALKVTDKYSEWIGTGDLAFEFFGVKLFGEYALRRVDYIHHPVMNDASQFVQNGDFVDDRKEPSRYEQSFYGIAAWTLPIKKLDTVSITPYGGFDYISLNDSLDWAKQKTLRFGLNVQPSPYVVLKAENVIDMFDDWLGGRMVSVAAQVAVSF